MCHNIMMLDICVAQVSASGFLQLNYGEGHPVFNSTQKYADKYLDGIEKNDVIWYHSVSIHSFNPFIQ